MNTVMTFLKKWWPALFPALLAAWHSALPSIQNFVAAHPKAATWYGIGAIFVATLFKSPLIQAELPTPGQMAGKIGPVLLLALLLPFGAKAQTNVAAPPTFHFVAGGSAIGFNAGQGTQAGSIAYTGLQLTTNIAVTYEYLSIPSISASGNLSVVSYTRPLNALLGKTLSSKFLFDTSNINVTFSGGAGQWKTTKNNIAETVGASVSYPIPGTSAAVQIIGYQYIHAPNVNGVVTRNQQVQTGLIVYF
jgi:hypothetical protein